MKFFENQNQKFFVRFRCRAIENIPGNKACKPIGCACVLVYATLWRPNVPTRKKTEMFWHFGINSRSSVVIYYAIMTLLTLVCSLFWPNLWSPVNAVIASCKSASRPQDITMFQKHRGSLGSSPLENIIQQVMQHWTRALVQNLILPSATCSWINIVINQSDLKNKFIIVKFRLTISVCYLYTSVIHLSFPLILGIPVG